MTRRHTPKTLYRCVDGPWRGHTLALSAPVTLPLTVGRWRGRYVSNGALELRWEAAP